MMQLIPNPPGKVTGGQILYNGKDLVKLLNGKWRRSAEMRSP